MLVCALGDLLLDVVSLVEPDGERTMASDRGVSPTLAPEEVDASFLEGAAWLILSGYSLMRPPLADAALRALAREAAARCVARAGAMP